jgi:hypothetical protein
MFNRLFVVGVLILLGVLLAPVIGRWLKSRTQDKP